MRRGGLSRFLDSFDRLTRYQADLGSVTSYYSLASYDRSRTRHGICKRKYYRFRGIKGSTIRRRPGPLGQLLVFIASKLAVCTRAMVLLPSWYIFDRIISIFFQRRQLKNAQCGPSLDWSSSVSARVQTQKEDNTEVGNFINVMRPSAVQLIADTTILKRWLQAVTLTAKPPSPELVSATRTTETIDCWAYELFFHLKYLQVNRARNVEKASGVEEPSRVDDEVTHINLWHRLVQLRDNYIILYETLYDEPKIHETMLPT
ncbi:uncharacterized protein [Venturia canescens]|uniref:uncharacterized protein n=1 Tax=Venturia canescens TaxID=32260 RepID=UPI001C9D2780|nr:uncharacterized protein LOC122407600 [Venturia canescens]